LIVVVGAGGTSAYEASFTEAAERWRAAAQKGGGRAHVVGREAPGKVPDRDRLRDLLAREARDAANTPAPLWLVLVGHGTFDGRTARFNLRGPDVSAEEVAAWLAPQKRPVVVINSASASAPFVKALHGPGRVVVSATKTGQQQSATRLNAALPEAIADPEADLDKDGQTSLLEAFLVASKRVEATYEAAGLLAAEHALLEDNGDGLGTPASFFVGLRPSKKPEGDHAADGYRAHQLALLPSAPERDLAPADRQRRDELELAVIKLRDKREGLSDDAYYAKLEPLLTELARLYERAQRR
jgi:hypothetical protein